PLQAQAENGWIGKRVITQYGTVLQVGNQVVDDEGRGKNLARGKDQAVFRIYKVEQANGPWLWLVAEGSGVKGWAPAAKVILFEQAIDHFTNQIRANPGASANYVWRANVWKARKEFDIAIADYNEAIRLDPGDSPAYHGRGLAWNAKKDYDKAIADYNEAIRLDPGSALAYIGRGKAWMAKKDYDKAVADFNEAIRLDPGSALAYFNRGGAWNYKKDYDKAIADINEAIRLDPGSALAYVGRGNAWWANKDYDKAIADYNEVIRLDPGLAAAYHNRGYAWSAKKDYDKAIADYDKAIRLDPGDALAYNNRGNAWRAKKDYDKAIADCNEAIRLDPGDALAYINRGVAFLLTGSEKAVDDERKFLELEGWRGEYSQYAVLLGYFGSRRAGKAEAARRFLDEAAAKCDTAAWPYPVIRYLRGEIDQNALLAAATDTDKMTGARCYLGLDLALKGRDDTAIEHYRWVVEHGTPTFVEYTIAAAELERLEKANQPRDKRVKWD
ncbi:MAG: tetratricopeptide repeat protein, partial [Isosphaeraceae bacterium]